MRRQFRALLMGIGSVMDISGVVTYRAARGTPRPRRSDLAAVGRDFRMVVADRSAHRNAG